MIAYIGWFLVFVAEVMILFAYLKKKKRKVDE